MVLVGGASRVEAVEEMFCDVSCVMLCWTYSSKHPREGNTTWKPLGVFIPMVDSTGFRCKPIRSVMMTLVLLLQHVTQEFVSKRYILLNISAILIYKGHDLHKPTGTPLPDWYVRDYKDNCCNTIQ